MRTTYQDAYSGVYHKALTPRLLTVYKKLIHEVIPAVEGSKSSDTIIQFRVLGHVPPPTAWSENTAKVPARQAGPCTPSISRRTTESGHATSCTRSSNLSPNTMYLNVDNGAALHSSKLKPRLTRRPTRRSALESVAPASHSRAAMFGASFGNIHHRQ